MQTRTIVGLVAAFAPFVISFSYTSSTSYNGVTTSCSSFNLLPLLGGIIAAVIGGMILKDDSPTEGNERLLALLMIGVGILQLLRGIGVFGGGC